MSVDHLPRGEEFDPLFQRFARIGHAMASPQRLVLLYLLAQGEKTVEALARTANFPLGNTSSHLRELRATGLVERSRRAGRVVYALAGPEVARALDELLVLGRALLLEDEPGAARPALCGAAEIAAAELWRRMEAGDAPVVVDLRPGAEYSEAHLPGALSLPFGVLAQRCGELPSGREVVVYCRGAYCTHCHDAIAELERRGYPAHRLRDGLLGWRGAGLPLASAPAGAG